MAITAADYCIWKRLRDENRLPENPAILEIGQANWYGDVPLEVLANDLDDVGKRDLAWLEQTRPQNWLFDVASLFYGQFLKFRTVTAIDLHGMANAVKHDLNYAMQSWSGQQRDIVINTGTAEHVWRIAQVFETMHDACRVGGLMFHCLPFRGWLDHGFWSVNPTLLMDLEAANGYERLLCAYFELEPPKLVWLTNPMRDVRKIELGENALLYVVWKKTRAEFVIPMQGYYAGTLSQEERDAWQTSR